jgi:membrane-anchored protein YejM (alkaline phosphatase superfamily)
LSERIAERIKHIFYIKEMENPYITVTEPVGNLDDEIRLERLLELVYESEKPFFAHVHMMGTHGAKFFPSVRKYSVGKHQTDDWMVDFYDDALLTYDASLQTLLDALVSSGKMDNTILIIYTDHGMGYTVNERIPLLIRFPNGEYSGKIKSNVQNLDIAPTILDYLSLPIPDWMEGHSLIQGEPPNDRLIFATRTYLASVGILISEQMKPPFFQFSLFNVIQCDKTYYVNLMDRVWIKEEVAGHTAPCLDEDMLTTEEIRQGLAEHLSKNKFDVSTLP